MISTEEDGSTPIDRDLQAKEAYYLIFSKVAALRNLEADLSLIEQKRTETAKGLRELDEYLTQLYIDQFENREKTRKQVALNNPEINNNTLYEYEDYYLWKLGKLKQYENDLFSGSPEDQLRADTVFVGTPINRTIGESGEFIYQNHWNHVAGKKDSDGVTSWSTLGDIHDWLSFNHIIASFHKGIETRWYHGTRVIVEGINLYQTSQRMFLGTIEPTDQWGYKSQVKILPSGEVIFNLLSDD